MILRALQLQRLTLTFKTPLRTGAGEFRVREGARIAARADEHTGVGEAMPLTSFGTENLDRAIDALVRASEALGERELPEEPFAIDALLDDVEELKDAPAARHAVEVALLDLAARRSGVPLRRLLADDARDRIIVNALLSAEAPDALAAEAKQAVEQGFRVLKIKVAARDIDEDLRRLSAVRAAVGPKVQIRIDANGAWTEVDAPAHLRTLCAVGIELCEQPVPARAVGALRGLRGAVPCQIVADEACASWSAAQRVLGSDAGSAADALVIRPMVLGGLVRSLRLARLAHERGVGAYVASSLDGIVARAAAAQVAAAMPLGDWAHGLATGALFVEERADAYAPRDGAIALPDSPGLGLTGRAA